MPKRSESSSQLERWTPHEQIDGPLIKEAQTIRSMLNVHRADLNEATYANERVLITPDGSFYHDQKPATSYFFIGRKDSLRSPVSCFIGVGEEDSPDYQAYRFSLSPEGIASLLDTPQESFSNTAILDEAITAVSSELKKRAEAKNRKRNSRIAKAASLALTGAVAFGVYEGISTWINDDNAAARRAKAARITFDNSNYQIPAVGSEIQPAIKVGDIPSLFFKRIPSYKRHDNLTDARKFKIDEFTCKAFPTRVVAGEEVVVATSSSDQIQNVPLYAYRDANGALNICDDHAYPGKYQTWTLAVQIKR